MSSETCNPRGPIRFLVLALACIAFVLPNIFYTPL